MIRNASELNQSVPSFVLLVRAFISEGLRWVEFSCVHFFCFLFFLFFV